MRRAGKRCVRVRGDVNHGMASLLRGYGAGARMNYEAKVSDLSGTSSVLIEDAENTGRSSRRGLVIAAVVLIALLIGGTMLFYSQSEESPFPVANGQQIPTVSVVAPGRTTVAGVIHSTGTLAARREMPVGVVGEGGRVVSVLVEPGDWVRADRRYWSSTARCRISRRRARRRRSRFRAPTPISRRPTSTARSSWSTAGSSARPTSIA
jgi:hypothetical protein